MNERGGELEDDLEELRNVEKIDGVDISMRFERYTPAAFREYFRDVVTRFRAKTGQDPKYDLVFLGEDLGKDDRAIAGKLRELKALADASGKYFGDICVKSRNSDFPALEPNVFSSNIRFELLED